MCKMEISLPVWNRTPTIEEEKLQIKDIPKVNDFRYKICYQIAFSEFFQKIKEETTDDFGYKCRRHGWIEGDVGYTYYPQCLCCSVCVEERTEEILAYTKDSNVEQKYTKPGTFQTVVEEDELEDFWDWMEYLYPFPEDFI
jgi:hypothetical protein